MWTRTILLPVCFLSSLTVSRAQEAGYGTLVAGSTTFPLDERSEDCVQNLPLHFDGHVGAEIKRCIRATHTTSGQQGQIVSGSTTFPLNEDTENCANRVQQVNPKKPGLAVSKCLRTPISTPAPDEPYFDASGCSKLKVEPQEGDTIVLKCKVGNLGSSRVTWLKTIRGHPTIISYGEDKAVKDDRISLVGNLNNTFDLEIERINSEDDGIYRCSIAGTQKSWNITIQVQVPPSIKAIKLLPGSDGIMEEKMIKKFIYNETDDIAIQCMPEGNPVPRVEWRKINERFTVRRGPNLTITNANRNDSGVYSCQVLAYLGPSVNSFREKKETEKRIEIVVQYKPEVAPRRTDIREPAGKYVQLECSVTSNPTSTYTWLKDNEPVPEYHSQVDKPKSTRLIILSLDPENDYGNYTCIASNILGYDVGYIEVSGKPRKPSIKSGTLSNKKHSYRLVWTNGPNGDPNEDASFIPINIYIIQYQGWWYVKKGDKISTQFSHQPPLFETYVPDSDSGSRFSYVLRDLRQNITYDVYLYGRNQYGDGEKIFFRFRTNTEDIVEPTVTPTPTQSIYGEMGESRNWYKPPKGASSPIRPTLWVNTSLICSYLLLYLLYRPS